MRFSWAKPVDHAVWADGIVLSHRQSGDTYLFSDVAKDILAFCLANHRFSDNDLIELTKNCFEDSLQVEVFVMSLLESLIEKDLIVTELQ